MNVLIVYAHPEPKSLNGSLKSFAVKHLEQAGHTVQVSDLYAMQWKASLDEQDNTAWQPGKRFDVSGSSKQAFAHGTQRDDIAVEQDKLRWADAVIFQFPLWWYSMPAILKGWIDRVYAYGFAYGLGEYTDTHWGNRFGEGVMVGKRAMIVLTVGGWQSHYGPRGVNGPMDDILFPIQHGMLFYPGFEVLPPCVIYRTSRVKEAEYETACNMLAARLDTLWITAPIGFRKQNDGDYDIPALTLRADIEPGASGLGIHVK